MRTVMVAAITGLVAGFLGSWAGMAWAEKKEPQYHEEIVTRALFIVDDDNKGRIGITAEPMPKIVVLDEKETRRLVISLLDQAFMMNVYDNKEVSRWSLIVDNQDGSSMLFKNPGSTIAVSSGDKAQDPSIMIKHPDGHLWHSE